jgi:hypothetical protein
MLSRRDMVLVGLFVLTITLLALLAYVLFP